MFAWIATIASGRLRLTVPSYFILGFLFIFTLGGLTGVMVAVTPFDWQAHDTYFVVAHLHYVLFGGSIFPIFAGLYYWMPKFSGKMLSEKLGFTSAAIMFIGFNVAFGPMHLSGLEGMPRRIYRYDAGHGSLVVLSSVAGERVRKANYVYGSSKAGLDGFAQGLGDALAGSGASVLHSTAPHPRPRASGSCPAAPTGTTSPSSQPHPPAADAGLATSVAACRPLSATRTPPLAAE